MLPRKLNGQFDEKSAAGIWEGFTEGDQWTYTFGAMHDVPGMISMMGGKDKVYQQSWMRIFRVNITGMTTSPGIIIFTCMIIAVSPGKHRSW